MVDKDRTGDIDARLRGLAANDGNLLPEDVCVEENRLCVDAIISGISFPASATLVAFEATPLAINAGAISTYVITTGKQLVIQQFTTGSEEESVGGNKCELISEPDTNPANDVNITRHYISGGNNFEEGITFVSAVGDGVAAVKIVRTRFGGGTNEVYAVFRGYEI